MDAVVEIVITTYVTDDPGGTGFGENTQEAFAGNPDQAKVRAVVVTGLGVIVMWLVTGCPAVVVTAGMVVAIVKSSPGGAITNVLGTLVAAL